MTFYSDVYCPDEDCDQYGLLFLLVLDFEPDVERCGDCNGSMVKVTA